MVQRGEPAGHPWFPSSACMRTSEGHRSARRPLTPPPPAPHPFAVGLVHRPAGVRIRAGRAAATPRRPRARRPGGRHAALWPGSASWPPPRRSLSWSPTDSTPTSARRPTVPSAPGRTSTSPPVSGSSTRPCRQGVGLPRPSDRSVTGVRPATPSDLNGRTSHSWFSTELRVNLERLQPADRRRSAPGVRDDERLKAGSTVPVTFTFTDASGAVITRRPRRCG